ncbi:MAG: N-acetylglucosamine kinase-like BadF-type ATPase [Bacteroidia bacterium]|jgi:glucosamine kinase
MVLIADSGSTKCDWILLDGKSLVTELSTIGFNPFYHNIDSIVDTMRREEVFASNPDKVTEVHFYGSGCSSPERNNTIESALNSVFTNAKIYVGHDVLGAAIAACQGKSGIACILGTGSNSCYFDGKRTSEVFPSLGYILGDEGSGAWFGKQLLTDYLYNESMPAALKAELLSKGFEKGSILENVYMKPHANVYLASFMKIIANNRQTEYVHHLIGSGMKTFLERHVCCFDNYKEVPTSFVGSVAFYFQDILKIECEKLGIQFSNVLQKPIDGLLLYHSAE